jgi:hypothetical protein
MPAVLGRDRRADETELGEPRIEVAREEALRLGRRDAGRDLALEETARIVAEQALLVGQLEIHAEGAL